MRPHEWEDRHLLIRVRLLNHSKTDTRESLCVEVEAQVDHAAIYPAGRLEIDVKQLQRAESAPRNEYGRLLGQRLASSLPLQTALSSVARASYLRIQLMLEPAGYPLSLLRWERVEFRVIGEKLLLCRGNDTPFSRFASINREEVQASGDTPFHLLVIVASPNGVVNISATKEFSNLLTACATLLDNGWMRITLAPGAQGIDDSLRAQMPGPASIVEGACTREFVAGLLSLGDEPVTGLHVIAHGSFHEESFHLFLEDKDRELDPVPSDELLRAWQLDRLRLVYLQCCQSALAGLAPPNDPRPHVSGFMQDLIEAGVPGVVAMQDFLRMDDARDFCSGFYSSLLRDGLADRAVNAGRALIPDDDEARWSIPAFSTRLVNSSVWVESPLRAAQQKLKQRIETQWKARNFRPLPIDVLSIGKAALDQRAPEGADEFVTLSRQAPLQSDVYALLEAATNEESPSFTCIIGPRGRAKTQLLEWLFLSQDPESSGKRIQPIHVILRLSDCAHPAYDPEMTVARAIASFYEDQTGCVMDSNALVQRFHRDRFVFLVRGDDNVGRSINEGLRLLERFAGDFKEKHRFILTLDQNVLRVRDLPKDTHCMIIQPMRAERVREFLSAASPDSAEQRLKVLLEENALYDLAEVPWLLNEMLEQARRGILEASRAEIIGRVVSEGVSQYTGSRASAVRVREALQRFAWEVQTRRDYFLPGSEAYEILQELRGNRDYPLFGFLTDMISSCNILASIGEDGVGFNFPGFRTYCAAEYLLSQTAERRTFLLEDITAQLGRQSRAELWRETLFILAGLWDRTTDLLRMILSGSLLYQGEQVFIAARCLQEARLRFRGPKSCEPIVQSIVAALLQMTGPGMRSANARNKAIQHLGPLREENANRPLTSIVVDRQRPGSNGAFHYDYSSVRLTAMKALSYSPRKLRDLVLNDPDWNRIPHLEDVVAAWSDCDGEKLRQLLQTEDPVSAIAAFALALTRTECSDRALKDRFDGDGLTLDTLWALTDSLIELASPDLDKFIAGRLQRSDRSEFVAHMIGKMGLAGEGSREWDFLRSNLTSSDSKLAGRSLQALAELSCADILPTCHAWLQQPAGHSAYFALQALRSVGTWDSLQLIETLRWNPAQLDNNRITFLDGIRMEVYEAIYWRLAGGLSRETMMPIARPDLTMKQKGAGA